MASTNVFQDVEVRIAPFPETGRAAPIRARPLFWEYGRNATAFAFPGPPRDRSPNVAVRDGKWKLLVNADGTGAELYDVVADPTEATNAAAANPDVARRLTTLALGWRSALP